MALLAAMLSLATLPALAQSPPPAQAIANLDMAAVPALDIEGIRRVQRKLREKAIDPGPADGVLGPRTTEAVRVFRGRYGMKADGPIDNQLLFALGEAELAISATRARER
jgi:peptidoglycan hydrolase-like protein with peptidoglycan-binding domain